jgi:hypothetical protein
LVILLRRIVRLLLLLCLPLYGFAMPGSLPPVAGAAALAHQLEHNQGVHHHHEADGSIHYDESDQSLDHAQEHCSPLQPIGFGAARALIHPQQPVLEPGSYLNRFSPAPFLDGPHRPPAPAPGHAAGGSLHA